MYFDIDELHKKLKKYYTNGTLFRAYISGEDIFPIIINLKKIQQKDMQNSFLQISNAIKQLKKQPFEVVFKEFDFKLMGKQNLPSQIIIKDLNIYLKIVDAEYMEFVEIYEKILARFEGLKTYFSKKPFVVLDYMDEWDRFLDIVEYFLTNKEPNIYIREICIDGVDTKFIQKHQKILDILISHLKDKEPLKTLANFAFEKRYNLKYPLAQVRFRILDEKFYISGLSDITLCIDEFKNLGIGCENIYIVENKITTLSFMRLKNSMVIFGSGYGISVLKDVMWLESKNIYYWGDIDLDGYAILSQLRGYFKNVTSLMMDLKTVERFKSISTTYTRKDKKESCLINLNDEELVVYDRLIDGEYGKNFRIEQEKIPYDYVRSVLSR
jgi:hypothetical protein